MANERSLPTRDALLDAALERFSTHGFGGTSIRDLAGDVGIRESSVYKHFPSKQAILDAAIERSDETFAQLSAAMGADAVDPKLAARDTYTDISTTDLESLAVDLLDAVAAEPRIRKLIGMLTIEQFRDDAVASRLRSHLLDGPIRFQTAIFTTLGDAGKLLEGVNASDAARTFWSPIACLLFTGQFGDDAREIVRRHVRHFTHTHIKEPS